MAHKYDLDPERKVDATTTGLGNHHTLFDFETMTEYHVRSIFVCSSGALSLFSLCDAHP